MFKLKPCPFCGGECKVVKTSWGYCPQCQGKDADGIWCHMHVLPLPSYNTPEEAAAAWNRRAWRTCHYIYDKEICAWRCSECGGLEPVGDHVRYCPDCGARVVEP